MKELKALLKTFEDQIRQIEKSHSDGAASNPESDAKQLDYYRGIREGIRICILELYGRE